VKITLKPVGKLIDGSAGKVIVLQRPLKQLSNSSYNTPLAQSNVLADIPLGRYQVTAVAGSQPMRLGNYPGSTEPVTVDFEPQSTGGAAGYILSITTP
jgi:hypothetical protein